jgi:hypothetical protein
MARWAESLLGVNVQISACGRSHISVSKARGWERPAARETLRMCPPSHLPANVNVPGFSTTHRDRPVQSGALGSSPSDATPQGERFAHLDAHNRVSMVESSGDFIALLRSPLRRAPSIADNHAHPVLIPRNQPAPSTRHNTSNRKSSMNQNDTRRSGRRRRGGRRRSNDREETVELKSAPIQNLWQKILAFFRPKTKPQRKSAEAQTKPARQYPEYEPRQKSANPAPAPRSQRKPEAVEVTSPKLYVGNLSFETAESDLFELFKGVGQVQTAEIVTHRESEKSKGFGFVTMTNVDEARRAVLELHDKEFMGRKLVVSGAKAASGR